MSDFGFLKKIKFFQKSVDKECGVWYNSKAVEKTAVIIQNRASVNREKQNFLKKFWKGVDKKQKMMYNQSHAVESDWEQKSSTKQHWTLKIKQRKSRTRNDFEKLRNQREYSKKLWKVRKHLNKITDTLVYRKWASSSEIDLYGESR